jgi:hypothetical protein
MYRQCKSVIFNFYKDIFAGGVLQRKPSVLHSEQRQLAEAKASFPSRLSSGLGVSIHPQHFPTSLSISPPTLPQC